MKLTGTFQSSRRSDAVADSADSTLFGSLAGRFGRSRERIGFPAEAERLITAAEFKRLSA